MRSKALLLVSALALAGCNLAPQQLRPVAPVAPEWPERQPDKGVAATAIGYADYFPTSG